MRMPAPDLPEPRGPRLGAALPGVFRALICAALAVACLFIGLRVAMAVLIGGVAYLLLYAMARVKDEDFQSRAEAWLESIIGGNERPPDDPNGPGD